MKVIIWGYPLHTHTHSYTHEAVYRAFKHLGYETHWFHDGNYPEDFDYNDCVFFTEGFADKNIPLRETSTYFVHVCVNPEKYIGKVKKLVDVRYLMNKMDSDNYSFVLDRSKCDTLDKGVLHERDSGDYEVIYMAWATNLLPEEIDLEWAKIARSDIYYFLGSISTNGRFANAPYINEFSQCCAKIGVKTAVNDPWQNPLDESENVRLTQKSFMCPDFRNETHKKWGYIGCRLMKAISFGQIGMTNSKISQEFIDDSVLYSESIPELFQLGLEHKDDIERIQHQMNIVRKEHTFVNRVQGLLKLI